MQRSQPCRLTLIVPAAPGPAFDDAFAAALAGGDVACAVLRAGADDTVDRALAAALMTPAHERDVALVLESDIAAAADLGADGVQIGTEEADYAVARDALGKDAIVGAACGYSRHDAMVLGELGADYVAFGGGARDPSDWPLTGLAAWWAELIEVPCMAWNPADMDEARALARAGADFLAVEDLVWQHTQGPGAAVQALNALLSEAREAA